MTEALTDQLPKLWMPVQWCCDMLSTSAKGLHFLQDFLGCKVKASFHMLSPSMQTDSTDQKTLCGW
jgi:hypothetical protein